MTRHTLLSPALSAATLIAVTLIGTAKPGVAQGQPVAIPLELARQIERDPRQAIDRFGRIMTAISSDGTISEMTIRRSEMAAAARMRANVLEDILAVDLDGDGVVIDMEIEASFGVGDARNRSNLMVMMAEADRNADRAVTFDEMRAYAAETVRERDRGRDHTESAKQLLALDLNRDGTLTMREMVEAVQRFSPKCACVE